jgi:hypothetical protein
MGLKSAVAGFLKILQMLLFSYFQKYIVIFVVNVKSMWVISIYFSMFLFLYYIQDFERFLRAGSCFLLAENLQILSQMF